GRVRMRRVPDASGANLLPFVRESIEPGSEVLTDAWGGYNDMTKSGYTRITTNLSDSGDPAHVLMPGVDRIASLLKRWLLGTHQGCRDRVWWDSRRCRSMAAVQRVSPSAAGCRTLGDADKGCRL
ncbi:MAG: transposase, partial [Gammaproteobacteria bacterium]